jgi:hypothetical protein
MKRLILFIFTLIFTFFLASCARQDSFRNQVNPNLQKENWMSRINVDANKWVVGKADRWFYTGEPYQLSQYAVNAPTSKSMTDMMVRVPNFTGLNIDGNFHVQIIGRQDANFVEIVGPNAAVRQVAVENWHGTVFIRKTKDCNANFSDVVIRIGVNTLRKLTVCGNAVVEGKEITSDGLIINSTCSGMVLLSGNINVLQINQNGTGTVTILGACAPSLRIKVNGNGIVNVSGRVGVQSISSFGSGCVNIIGADSDGLVINTGGGRSTIKIAGYVNLKKVNASSYSRVYLYWVNSNGLYVNARDCAIVSLAGCTTNMNVDLSNSSRFNGQYLRAGSVYVRTRDAAHANVTADQKMFASATDNSSIYFYGSPSIVSRFVSENGVIIPVWSSSIPSPALPLRQSTTWDFKGQQRSGAYTTPYNQKAYK